MSSNSLQVPPSPSSSKRSRSKDSARTEVSPIDTPYMTPSSVSAPSLVIPQPAEPQSDLQQPPLDLAPYPAFLKLSRADIHQKFLDIERESRQRPREANQNPQGDAEQLSYWARCNGDEMRERNRYVNVDPYQGNRVRLKVPEGLNDYINASPVVLHSTKSDKVLRYIATQGPKHDTYSHFWRMVWHETTSPAVVVMLTQTTEAARDKCFPYYPETLEAPILPLNPQNEYEDGFIHELKLTSLEDREDVRAEVRELDMTTEDGSESKKTWHLLFAGWPDFLVPQGDDRDALLRLIDLSREKNVHNETNPRIVHCSAGVGRSGTFIALDWLLQELEEGSLDEVQDNEDPILTVVSNMRKQRMMMVQSEAQFVFIYDLLKERWRDRWISQHPEEAERLGVGRRLSEGQEGPRLKRQKSQKQHEGDEEEKVESEAELFDADIDVDKDDA